MTTILKPLALAATMTLAFAAPALAQDAQPQAPSQAPAEDKTPVTPEAWAVHLQVTDILQHYPAFHSAFQGPNSFRPQATTGNTVDATLYAGVKPWAGGEIWGNLEMYQGYAPNNTLGAAGYVNGDGAKVGRSHPYARIARLFIRQTFDLGGEADDQEADLNALGRRRTKDRVVLTAGKLNATDVFDTNKYAHDPRQDFLNWSLITAGSFDYAADAWGYTYGAAAEWYRGDWAWRAGVFDLSIVPNNAVLTSDFSQFQVIGEAERRFTLGGRPGAVRLAGFVTRGGMGRYDDATALALATGKPADAALVRHYRSRPGAYLNVEQEVADGVGLFGRLGWADGTYEAYEYTDIDRTAQAGVSVSGERWGRKGDTVAAAVVVNDLSSAGERYLNAGGLGILIGDGRLPHPGAERILETYYSLGFAKGMTFSLDNQLIQNPAYNRDRGPVDVVSLRLHLER
ncbi:MAG TPA: carbohydrate porin [Phenylobacterium sp.]|jgi:high affinity Mn2+ porin|uniref:carbohydrate porin n=1 Tax=Phenylobacterium sp. TaxID=1871053 RepID=UPI002CAAAC4A|nr:carbohydrate porin [Phenylobacterium sp.]HXA38779.1 carbohydrate porin [Phenylobacterium sp.]